MEFITQQGLCLPGGVWACIVIKYIVYIWVYSTAEIEILPKVMPFIFMLKGAT
jgi:hypothetical protein